jgi:hypothetical protein
MIQSVFHLDDFWNNRSENQNINQLENLGLEKKKTEIFILSRGFVFNRNASDYILVAMQGLEPRTLRI